MGKELKVDRLWLSHSTPIFAFSLLTFFGHKRIHRLEFFVWGQKKWVLHLSVAIALTQHCTYLFCQPGISMPKQSYAHKQTKLDVTQAVLTWLVQCNTSLCCHWLRLLGSHLYFTNQPAPAPCPGLSCTKKSSSQTAIQIREPIHLQTDLFFPVRLVFRQSTWHSVQLQWHQYHEQFSGKEMWWPFQHNQLLVCRLILKFSCCQKQLRHIQLILSLRCCIELFSSFKFYHK